MQHQRDVIATPPVSRFYQVGRSATQFGYHAFVWTNIGGIVDLGTLGGAESKAVKINAAGKAAGESALADGSVHAVIWSTQ